MAHGVRSRARNPVHITDDEDLPELELSIDREEIGEEQGPSVTVTISITNGTTFSTDQVFTITFGGTATEGADFVVIPSDADSRTPGHQVTLPASSISVTVTITALDDDDEDPGEELEIHVDLGDKTIGNLSIPIRNRPLGPEVEITFEGLLSPRNGYDAGTATGPFTTRIAFSERVEGGTAAGSGRGLHARGPFRVQGSDHALTWGRYGSLA